MFATMHAIERFRFPCFADLPRPSRGDVPLNHSLAHLGDCVMAAIPHEGEVKCCPRQWAHMYDVKERTFARAYRRVSRRSATDVLLILNIKYI